MVEIKENGMLSAHHRSSPLRDDCIYKWAKHYSTVPVDQTYIQVEVSGEEAEEGQVIEMPLEDYGIGRYGKGNSGRL